MPWIYTTCTVNAHFTGYRVAGIAVHFPEYTQYVQYEYCLVDGVAGIHCPEYKQYVQYEHCIVDGVAGIHCPEYTQYVQYEHCIVDGVAGLLVYISLNIHNMNVVTWDPPLRWVWGGSGAGRDKFNCPPVFKT